MCGRTDKWLGKATADGANTGKCEIIHIELKRDKFLDHFQTGEKLGNIGEQSDLALHVYQIF